MTTTPAYVRCKDNSLVTDKLKVGQVYAVEGEQNSNYLVQGLWLTRGRFRVVTEDESRAGVEVGL